MGGFKTFTEDEIREMVRQRAAPCAINKRSTGVTEWCRTYGLSKSHVVEFLAGKRGPPNDMLSALRLERIYRLTPTTAMQERRADKGEGM